MWPIKPCKRGVRRRCNLSCQTVDGRGGIARGTFTYAAHHAFFAGFLPTPTSPGPHPRLFAARFAGSETTTDQTAVFDAPDIVTGLSQRGYRDDLHRRCRVLQSAHPARRRAACAV